MRVRGVAVRGVAVWEVGGKVPGRGGCSQGLGSGRWGKGG